MSSGKTARTLTAVPQDLRDANTFVRLIGNELRSIEREETRLNERISAIKKTAEPRVRAHEERVEQLAAALLAYYEVHRVELTRDKKTVTVPNGEFGAYLPPPTLVMDTNEREVVAALKRMRRKLHVRVKEEVDRQSLKKDEPAVKLLSKRGVLHLQQDEMFTVKPTRAKTTLDRKVRDLTRISEPVPAAAVGAR